MAELSIGSSAPDFDLPRDGGGRVKLTDFRGKALVIFFYPKDDTSGCTTESIAFTALADEFEKAGAIAREIEVGRAGADAEFRHGETFLLPGLWIRGDLPDIYWTNHRPASLVQSQNRETGEAHVGDPRREG